MNEKMMQLVKESVDDKDFVKLSSITSVISMMPSELDASGAKSLQLTIGTFLRSSDSTVSDRTKKGLETIRDPLGEITGGPRSGSPPQPLIGTQNQLPASRYPSPPPRRVQVASNPTTTVSNTPVTTSQPTISQPTISRPAPLP